MFLIFRYRDENGRTMVRPYKRGIAFEKRMSQKYDIFLTKQRFQE
jgi:hypothetical protein